MIDRQFETSESTFQNTKHTLNILPYWFNPLAPQGIFGNGSVLQWTLEASPFVVSSIHDKVQSFLFGRSPIVLLQVEFHIAVDISIMNSCDKSIELDNSFVIPAAWMPDGGCNYLLPVVDCDLIGKCSITLFAFVIGPFRSMTPLPPNVYAISTTDTPR